MNGEAPELLDLPFDQYQRYRLLAEAVAALRPAGRTWRILEVGGFPPRLDRFLPQDQVLVVDRPAGDSPHYLQADGTRLPFADREFDLVASLDTLEHIAPERRPVFLDELCRAARDFVVLAAPFRLAAAREAERIIFDFIRLHAGYEHAFFKEHLEQEAPDLVACEAALVAQGFHTLILANGRLDHWLLLMAIYYYLDGRPEYTELKNQVMAYWNRARYRADNAEPAYRHFIVASRQPFGEALPRLQGLMSDQPAPAPDFSAARAVIELARLDGERTLRNRIAELEDQLAARAREAAGLRAELDSQNAFVDRFKSSLAYRAYAALFKAGW
jgi:hypothetical protein